MHRKCRPSRAKWTSPFFPLLLHDKDIWQLRNLLLFFLPFPLKQGLIYIAGGCNDVHEVLDSFASYNPVIKEWTTLPPLRHPRCFFSLVAIDDHIYALGGQSGPSEHDNALDACERFSLLEQDSIDWRAGQRTTHRRVRGWTSMISTLPSPRAGHSALAINSCIMVVGGRDNGSATSAPTTLTNVDRYDPEYNTWTRVGGGMLESHCEAATVLV